ncbi:MAG: S8 family serine peptidase [Chitinophagales bacterium]|nr:S8 family serine peptidase [Chitinophagales bacterium]
MNIRAICFVFLCASFTTLFAQNRLNLYTQRMLEHASPDKTTIDLFVRGDFDEVKQAVQQAKGNYKFGYGEYSSVTIPLVSLEAFLKSPAVKGVENGERELVGLSDTAIIVNCVLPIHHGDFPLDTSYLGDGVIMGIIDFGIDFNHPDFKKSNGDTRIRYLWDQNVANVNSPMPYAYGQEWTEFEINAGQCTHIETGNAGHGTTVCGIAAGNGRACNGRYVGMAPNTDMIVVAFNFGRPFLSSFMDAADYIFKKADAMGKPCVINASLGAYWGSHDGRDPAGLLINSLLEERSGRSLVCAAGNAGNLAFHLGYDVTADTSFTWFAYDPSFSDYYFDFWADTQAFNKVYFAIGTDNPATWSNVGLSNFLNVVNNYTFNVVNGDTVASYNFVQVDSNGTYLGNVSTNIYQAQGRYNIEVRVTGPSNPAHYYSFITTGSGRIDGWNSAISDLAIYSSEMVTSLPDSITRPDIVHYKLPDATQNIVSSFTCSEKVIAVGNFTNRKSYPDCDSNLTINASTPGEIFFSSSIGPNRRGFTKPDISATGDFTVSAGNASIIGALGSGSFKVGYCPSGNCPYMRNGGTSMASPIVAGIAALYLQKNPNADWREIKDAIVLSAISDSFTGVVPNNTYGNGKVQGCAAMMMHLVYGCMDTAAFNYNADGTIDDGTCIPKIYGCIDSTAFNFDNTANTDDGSCIAVILGCIDSLALNFDSLANTDDGSCYYVGIGSLENGKIKLAFVPNFFKNETNIIYQFEKPFPGKTIIVLTNLLGQTTDEIELTQEKGTILYRPASREAGVYFYHLTNEGKILLSGKVVVY